MRIWDSQESPALLEGVCICTTAKENCLSGAVKVNICIPWDPVFCRYGYIQATKDRHPHIHSGPSGKGPVGHPTVMDRKRSRHTVGHCPTALAQSVLAATTKHHRIGDFNKYLFLMIVGIWEFESKAPAGLV